MALTVSNPFNINVVSWAPPYSLPAVGQVVAISSGQYASSVAPSGWTAAAVDYSTFGSYGGGVFVPEFSVAGAWVAAGFGGHNHPDHVGAFVFDFATGSWSRRDNANGVALQPTYPHSYPLSRGNGSPYYEIDGTAVPFPPHPYAHGISLPLGAQGSFVYVGRSAMGTESNVATTAVHRFDLATRLWSRLTNNTASRSISYESDSVLDTARNRVWVIPQEQHNHTSVMYFDLADYTYKFTATHGFPPGSFNSPGRCFMHGGLLFKQVNGGTLYYFDPDNASAGWGQCTLSGSLPTSSNRFVPFGGSLYHRGNGSGNTLTRLVPPANLKTGTWQVSTVTPTGATMAAKYDGGVTPHYTNLFPVPAINCLAWIPGGSNPVYLIRPE